MEPRIIPRKEHRISRKQISPNVLRALYRLRDNGYIAYLVGGCVRDLLMERTPKDFDIATDAAPGQIKRLFRNCRLVGRRFRLAHLHFQNEIVEVSTFRAAAPSDEADTEELVPDNRPPRHLKNGEGMILRDNIFGTPEEDALRRDFTINALAYNIVDYSVIDYSTGLSDLHERLIRPIGDPYVRFTEDPVRMLRAVRFAASHNLEIEPATWEILCELSATISRASPGRLYEEILKLFLLGSARPVFGLLDTSGLLAALFPMLSQWLRESSHRLTVMHTNLECLDRRCQSGTPPSPSLFFAAFFGPHLEEAVLALHRDGITHQQALNAVFTASLKEICKTVSIPGRVCNQLRGILAMQPSLHRRPPRRPSVMAGRPEFADAFAYLRLAAEASGENRAALEWWDAFLSGVPSTISSEPPTDEAPAKRRKKRRRRRRPAAPAAECPRALEEQEHPIMGEKSVSIVKIPCLLLFTIFILTTIHPANADTRNQVTRFSEGIVRAETEKGELRQELAAAKVKTSQEHVAANNKTIEKLTANEWFAKGYSYQAPEKYNDALDAYSKAIKLNPKYVEAYINRGFIYGRLGNYNQAIKDFDRAIELDPQDAMAFFYRGMSYTALGNDEQAVADLKIAAGLGDKFTQDFLRSKGMTW